MTTSNDHLREIPEKYLEEIPERPLDPDKSLSDDELQAAGLVPIAAYVRTKTSRNAERIRKSRAKVEAGSSDMSARKQLNLTAPADEDARDILKMAAAGMLDGDLSPSQVLAALNDSKAVLVGTRVNQILDAGGVRAMILRHLIS